MRTAQTCDLRQTVEYSLLVKRKASGLLIC